MEIAHTARAWRPETDQRMTMFKVTLTASGRRTPHFDTFRLNVTWQGTLGIDSGTFWHHRTQLVSTHTKLCSCRQDLGRKGSLGGDGPTGFRQLKGRFVKADDLLVNINFFFDHLIILNERIQSLRSHDLFRIQVNPQKKHHFMGKPWGNHGDRVGYNTHNMILGCV